MSPSSAFSGSPQIPPIVRYFLKPLLRSYSVLRQAPKSQRIEHIVRPQAQPQSCSTYTHPRPGPGWMRAITWPPHIFILCPSMHPWSGISYWLAKRSKNIHKPVVRKFIILILDAPMSPSGNREELQLHWIQEKNRWPNKLQINHPTKLNLASSQCLRQGATFDLYFII